MKSTSIDILVQSNISTVGCDFETVFFCPAFSCPGFAYRKMQDWMSEFSFMRAGATGANKWRSRQRLGLSYDFHHFLVPLILVIVIDNLNDDYFYTPVSVARRCPGPNGFLWRRGLRLLDYHLSRLRVGDGHGLGEI